MVLLLSLLCFLSLLVSVMSCGADFDYGPFTITPYNDMDFYFPDTQNISFFNMQVVDALTGAPSNFVVKIYEESTREVFSQIGLNGCAAIPENLTNLIGPVQVQVSCTNMVFFCEVSFSIEVDICISVCRGEVCGMDGCGRQCESCRYPCPEDDYCFSYPETETEPPSVSPDFNNTDSQFSTNSVSSNTNKTSWLGISLHVIPFLFLFF